MTDINNQPPKEEPVKVDVPNSAQDQKSSINVTVPVQKKGTSGMAVAALVLGILAIVFSFIPLINLMSFIFVVLGVIFGIVGIMGTGAGKKAGRGIAMAGLIISVVAGLVTFVMYASAGSDSSSETTVTEVVEEGSNSSSASAASSDGSVSAVAGASSDDTYEKATDSNYAVTIDSCKQTKDYAGKPAVVVTYTWTNNSDEDRSFMTAISGKVFQDGVQLDTAVVSNTDTSDTMKEIKPGKSLKVKMAYELDNTKSPVTVECSEWVSFDDALLAKKTFDLNK